tara:strand:- start:4432 stop:5742 length:1311 start_codon:yes stop_codon:yes gene_type:complete
MSTVLQDLTDKYRDFGLKLMFLLILIILINGRSLIGVYLFGFRLGELLTGFAIFLLFFIMYKNKFFREHLGSKLVYSYFILVTYFLIFNLINSANFLDLYIYKSSVFIWYISFMFFGYIVFKNVEITKNFFYLGYLALIIQFMFNVVYYPDFLTNFFNAYSDKTQFLKGSEIAIFFIVVTFFANKFTDKGPLVDLFVLTSSIYIPLIFFKSRSAAFALFIYIVFLGYSKKKYFIANSYRSFVLFFISIILFLTTAHLLVDNVFEVEETPEAVIAVFKHKYVVSNSFDDEVPFFYFYEKRIYSADGNLNWRLQLWQDIFMFASQNNEIIFGQGFEEKPLIFDNFIYGGLDGLNENSHNYFLNIFMRGGVFGLLLVLYFFYNLIKVKKTNFYNYEFLIFLLPLFFISMFDGSMENPYFAIVFYFFLSSFFSGVKFKNR